MQNLRRVAACCTLSVLLMLLAGCITVEKKEYRYTLKPDGTGEGTIRFVNIRSADDSKKDVSFKDFAELVTDYLQGSKFEDDYPALHVAGKKLVEENGTLVGEVNFTFTAADSAGFLRGGSCACCPVLYFLNTDKGTETITETSGRVVTGVTSAPLVEWDGKTPLTLKTTVSEDTTNSRNLLTHYHQWAKK